MLSATHRKYRIKRKLPIPMVPVAAPRAAIVVGSVPPCLNFYVPNVPCLYANLLKKSETENQLWPSGVKKLELLYCFKKIEIDYPIFR